jgi:alginate O-acetyltransferase complex protein AlgI
MLMNPLYLVFFTLAAWAAYTVVSTRFKLWVLLAANLIFIGLLLAPVLWAVLGLLVLATHWLAGRVQRNRAAGGGPGWMWLGVGFNLSVLVLFKYLAFLVNTGNSLLRFAAIPLAVPSPSFPVFIGISYLVFQTLSYLLDVYFGTLEREPRFFQLVLHLCLFPKFIQGPIERAGQVIAQLKENRGFDYENFRQGLLLMAWGLFKKAVIADRLVRYLDPVFHNAASYNGFTFWLATYGFMIQLFCDFSGYTDMALGAARLFNLRLTQNFNAPFLATGIQDFWKRWHISLSSWILEYLFQPLQMAFRGLETVGNPLALFIAFCAVGIWHGAKWGFIVFGLIQGTYMASALLYRPFKKRLYQRLGAEKKAWLKGWQVFVTIHLVCFSIIFFETPDISSALLILTHLFQGWSQVPSQLWGPDSWWSGIAAESKIPEFSILAVSLALLPAVHFLKNRVRFYQRPAWFRWAVYYSLALALFLFGAFFAEKQFFYSQF